MKDAGKIQPIHAIVAFVVVAIVVVGVVLYVNTSSTSSGDQQLKVGALNTMTGDLSFVGPPFLKAEELAISHINEAGGVLGKNVVLVSEDTQTTSSGAVDAARKLIDVNGVDTIVGSVSTFGTMAVVNIIADDKVPTISPSATAPEVTNAEDDDFLFRTCPSDSLQGAAIAAVADERGYEKACVLSRNDAYGIGLEQEFSKTFEGTGGTVLKKVRYDPSAATFNSYIRQLADRNPDVIELNGLMEDGVRILQKAADMGVTEDVDFLVSEGVQDPNIPSAVGKNSAGDYIVWAANVGGATPYPIGGGPFDEEYEAEYGEAPSAYCANAYDAVILFALAAEKAGSTKGKDIKEAIRDVANSPGTEVSNVADALSLIRDGQEINYQGASGEITFDSSGDVRVSMARKWWYAENGEIVIRGNITVGE